MSRKSGFVAIVGQPNVGKSTLLNFMIGEKLAGVSPKPQTTRGTVHGILTREEGQIVFLDTPGMHVPKDRLGNWMAGEVEKSLEGADVIVWMILPGRIDSYDQRILRTLKEKGHPVILVINQMDRFPKEKALPVIEHYSEQHDFLDIIPISAKKGVQVDILIETILKALPEGVPAFPEDQISDQNIRFIVSELIREQIYLLTREEIPYGTAVVIDEFNEREDGITEIHATLIVERDGQKAILIGKKGEKMKEIGQEARLTIEHFLDTKVFLKLWVKPLEHWKRDDNMLRQLGFQ